MSIYHQRYHIYILTIKFYRNFSVDNTTNITKLNNKSWISLLQKKHTLSLEFSTIIIKQNVSVSLTE